MKSDNDAEIVWEMILNQFSAPSWNTIEEVKPDKIDLQMLSDIENDSDCHEFISEDELAKYLNGEQQL